MKILLVPPFGMGDNLMFLPLAYNLKKNIPKVKIYVLSSIYNGAFDIMHYSDCIDCVIPLDLQNYKFLSITKFYLLEYKCLIGKLNAMNFDSVISINTNFLRFSIIKRLKIKNKIIINDPRKDRVQTSLKVLNKLGLKRYPLKLRLIRNMNPTNVLLKYKLKKNNYLLFNLYGQKNNRNYKNMVNIFNNYKFRNYSNVAIGKNKNHKEFVKNIDLVNKTEIHEIISLINDSRLIITPDGGLMHLAVFMNKPVLALFGSITSYYFSFYKKNKNFFCIDAITNQKTEILNIKKLFRSEDNVINFIKEEVVVSKIREIINRQAKKCAIKNEK